MEYTLKFKDDSVETIIADTVEEENSWTVFFEFGAKSGLKKEVARVKTDFLKILKKNHRQISKFPIGLPINQTPISDTDNTKENS